MASPLHTQSKKYFVKTTQQTEQDTLTYVMYPDMPKAVAPVRCDTKCIRLTTCMKEGPRWKCLLDQHSAAFQRCHLQALQ